MPHTGLWLRVFLGLLLAVLPPLVLLVGAVLLTDMLLSDADPNLVAILVMTGAIGWGAILAVVYARSLAEDLRSFRTLAERGDDLAAGGTGSAYQQIAGALDERNRQIAALAREASRIPIDHEPERVLRAVVSSVRSVMRDETWRAAIVHTAEEALRAGVYLGSEDDATIAALTDLERWAAVTEPTEPARHVVGPWGAFAVVDASASDRVTALLYAPWEGRAPLAPADRAILTLVGQHAGTALDHSVLYARVRAQAEELNRLALVQADFLRSVSHDLQTPLTSIGAVATELQADDRVPASVRQDLDTIAHQAERLRRMVAQLLVASRLEAGAFVPQVEVFSVRPLLERTWLALRADRPFEVSEYGTRHLAVGDPDRVEQVLWALLDNAVKYSPAGSPIRAILTSADGAIELTIRDEGIGMDDATRACAFEQFYRSERARQLVPDGSGVGLYAARGLMQAMGGDLWLDSGLGAGSAFTLRLPAEPAEASGSE